MDTEETVLVGADDFFAWRRPKPKMSILGAHVGRLIVTSRQILFLSTGTSGAGRAMLAALGGPIVSWTLGRTRTDELDLSALENEGSLAVPLLEMTAIEMRRRWDFASYLTLTTTARHELPPACAFMTKIGFNRDELARIVSVAQKARAALETPYR